MFLVIRRLDHENFKMGYDCQHKILTVSKKIGIIKTLFGNQDNFRLSQITITPPPYDRRFHDKTETYRLLIVEL
jgi:hypothetical protein